MCKQHQGFLRFLKLNCGDWIMAKQGNFIAVDYFNSESMVSLLR